jgi:cobalamin biosynthesis protein CbiM
MVNLPVLATSSAHFVGGVLLAELLGPALGAMIMAVVLLLQAALLGDGGLAALGVNIASMALLPAGVVALLKRLVAQQPIRAAAASAISIALAVLLISGAVALGRSTSELAAWPQFVAALAIAHLPVLVLEAVASVGLLLLWKRAATLELESAWRVPTAVTAFAALVIALSGAISSDLPDGYESAAQRAMPMLIAEQD